MNSKKVITIIVVVLAVIGLVLFMLGNNDETADQKVPAQVTTETTEPTEIVEPTQVALNTANYLDYNSDNFTESASTDRVLFFHASWCPTCHALDKSLLESGVPDDITILKVDYDSSPDLRQKYGVRSQHTLVHVDEMGELINSWYGSYSIEEIQANL